MNLINVKTILKRRSDFALPLLFSFILNFSLISEIFANNEDIDPCYEVKLRTQNSRDYQKDLTDLYESERIQIASRLKKYFPQIEDFRAKIVKSDFEHSVEFQYRNHGEDLWRILPSPDLPTFFRFVKNSNQLLILEQYIHPKYREVGLSKLATIAILKTHPNTKSFAANLVEVNASSFFTTLLDRQKTEAAQRKKTLQFLSDPEYESKIEAKFLSKFFKSKAPSEIKQLRNEILQIYQYHTPAGRIRSSLGFKNIQEIRINFNSKDSEYWINVIVEKGSTSVYEPVMITINYTGISESREITLTLP